MTYIINTPEIGIVDLSTVVTAGSVGSPWIGTTNALPGMTPEQTVGMIVSGYDTASTAIATGAGGGGEFIFLRVPTSTTVTPNLLYRWNASTYDIVVVPTAVAGLGGAPVAVAINTVASNSSSVQYTWFQIGGRCTVLKTAVAASPDVPVYISNTTAGRVRFVASAFRGVLGARTANATSVTATTSTVAIYLNGRPVIAAGI